MHGITLCPIRMVMRKEIINRALKIDKTGLYSTTKFHMAFGNLDWLFL